MSNILDVIRYRWVFESDPLPGVLDSVGGANVVLMTVPEDEEPVKWKRKVRAVLFGYGQGWTLNECLLNQIGL